MKANSLLLLVAALSLHAAPHLVAAPLATAFTYQGKLNDGAAPASGNYDFRFTLYDAVLGGIQVGNVLTAENLEVAGGVFSTSLDFGAAFDGSSRWIELAVRTGASVGDFTVLNPRQPLTATPYALYALTPAGPQGTQGIKGDTGLTGPQGLVGPTGSPGAAGAKGDTGAAGSPGATGANGIQGPAGTVGAAGAKGDKGDIGLTGSTGLTGTQGAAGPTGASGPQGAKGNTGLTGAAGAVGPQGIQGVPGAVGLVGPQGPIGLKGATGAAGATGPVGPTGAKGEKGVNWRGTWNGVTIYAIGDGVAQNGASWLAKAVSTGTAPSVSNPSWDLLADKGAIGATGSQGMIGLSGPIGATGPQGIPGSADGWSRTGNNGTTVGTHFLGTTDDQALEFKVHGIRALRLEPTVEDPAKSEMVNVLAGSPANLVGAGVYGATIAGGGAQAYSGGWYPNRVTQDSGTVGGGLGNHSGGRAATVGGGFRNISTSDFATVGGGLDNTGSGYSATVSGGSNNSGSGDAATVGGGTSNTSSDYGATVGGGLENTSSAKSATVGGGQLNKSSFYGTVGGGLQNESSGSYATVGGGADNIAGGSFATVPGGVGNHAAGLYSLAAGARARANHDGSFVWAIRDNPAPSFAPSRFHINAYNGLSVDYDVQRPDGGGTKWIVIGATSGGQAISTSTGAWLSDGGVWSNFSDRNGKDTFTDVNAREILDKVAALPIQTWHYTNEIAEIRHLGPVAQDFRAAFGLGTDDKSIGTVDADGVALAAIQGLNQKVESENSELRADVRAKGYRIAALERSVAELKELVSGLAQAKGGAR